MKTGDVVTYVRRPDSDAWHWIGRCSHFPKRGETRTDTKNFPDRPHGDLCNECKAKEKTAGK